MLYPPEVGVLGCCTPESLDHNSSTRHAIYLVVFFLESPDAWLSIEPASTQNT